MTELDIQQVGRRATLGIIALTSRTAFLQVVAYTGVFILTILLDPKIFGVFVLVSASVSILNYFSDIGLAGALIRKKEKITDIELKTTFTIQQLLVGTISVAAWLLSSNIGRFYNLAPEGVTLFKALVISFFLSSLKTIPSVILERQLSFNRLVIPQIIETLIFYFLAVVLAWQGWGITSFTIAVLFRSISGLIVLYIIAPWRPGFSFDTSSAKGLLSFGVPFQLNSFLAVVKDDFFTLFLGKVLSFTELSYVGWAKKWAEAPLRLLMDNIIRVTFPAYARLQHDRIVLQKAVEKSLFFLALLTIPMATYLVFSIQPVVSILPRYSKWEPAIFSFYLFAGASVLSTITTPLVNLLNSIGKVKTTLSFMVVWTVLTWTVIPALIPLLGFHAVAAGVLLISFSIIAVIYVVKRYCDFSIAKSLVKPILANIPLVLFLIVSSTLPFPPLRKLVFHTVVGGGLWLLSIWLIAKEEISWLFHKFRYEK